MAQAAEAGLTGWEPLLHEPQEAERVGALAREHGLTMPSVFVSGSLHDEAQAGPSIARLAATVRAAARQGCRLAAIYPSALPAEADKSDDELRLQARNLAALGAACGAEGVRLLYHPEEREMRHAAREVHHMLLATEPHLVGLCLDPDTIWRGAGRSMVALLDIIALHGGRIGALHLRQSRDGSWAETVEEGDLDHPAIAAALAAAHLRPLLVLEHAAEPGTPAVLSAVDAHRRSRRYVENVFASALAG